MADGNGLADGLSGMSLVDASSNSTPPPPSAPPMPTSLSPYARASQLPPSAPSMPQTLPSTQHQQKDQQTLSFEQQQMVNLPAGLLTTALKPGTKKPFSYTPVGLSAADLKSPSVIRKEKLDSGTVSPAPHAPSHYRVFNGISVPSESDHDSRPHTPSLTVKSDDDTHRRYKNESTGPPLQSRSFRILQWMTGADEDEGSSVPPIAAAAPEPEEIKFRGYCPPETIPSRSFQALNRFNSQPQPTAYSPPQQDNYNSHFRTDFSEEEGSALRYQGAAIPSRSFQMLQNMTDANGAGYQRRPSWNGQQTPSVQQIPEPSPLDFKYQGPQYSTYQLPEKRSYSMEPVFQPANTRPVYSSAVSLTPQNNAPSPYQQQAYTSNAFQQPQQHSFYSPSPSSHGFHRQISASSAAPQANYYASSGTSDF